MDRNKKARIINSLTDANEAIVQVYLEVPPEHLDAIKPIQTGILTLMRNINEQEDE